MNKKLLHKLHQRNNRLVMIKKNRIYLIFFFILFLSIKGNSQSHSEIGAQLDGENSLYFKKKDFKKKTKLESIERVDINYGEKIKTDSFNILVIRKNKIVFHSHNKGGDFNKKIIAFFDKLVVGDKILFIDIYATSKLSRRTTYLAPLEYNIN